MDVAATWAVPVATSVETWLLINIQAGLLALGIVVVCLALSLGGLLLVRRSVKLSTLEAHHEVAGFILAVVGVVYAVLLAFVVVIVWQQFDEARVDADREATAVVAVYRDAAALDELGPDARPALRRYAELVVDDEWETMAVEHAESPLVDDALNTLWTTFQEIEPRSQAEIAFYTQAIGGMHDISELRRDRIEASGAELPIAMWGVLIIGAVISVAFTFLFGVRSFLAQALMVASLAALIGIVLALILALDLPFTGGLSVGPDSMQDAIEEFDHISG